MDQLKKMLEELSSDGVGMPLVTELILGLPEQTRQSHLDDNRTFIDEGAEMNNYNLFLLPGTEMDTKESREKWFKKTGVPILLNTSFNDREPIVETPAHAIKCFLSTEIDYLYFADVGLLVTKRVKDGS